MSDTLVKYLFVLFSIMQGCLVLGLTIFIFGYYIPKRKDQIRNSLRWHVATVAGSYILLTLATIKTAAMGFYNWGDAWYWVVTVAYIAGDISLLYVFKHSVKKRKINEHNKN